MMFCLSLDFVCMCDMIELNSIVEVLLTWARDEIVGSEGLGQHFLKTALLTLATGIYFHKQGREMFFIPYLSASFAVFLVLS